MRPDTRFFQDLCLDCADTVRTIGAEMWIRL